MFVSIHDENDGMCAMQLGGVGSFSQRTADVLKSAPRVFYSRPSSVRA
jgi:hypothetical protein